MNKKLIKIIIISNIIILLNISINCKNSNLNEENKLYLSFNEEVKNKNYYDALNKILILINKYNRSNKIKKYYIDLIDLLLKLRKMEMIKYIKKKPPLKIERLSVAYKISEHNPSIVLELNEKSLKYINEFIKKFPNDPMCKDYEVTKFLILKSMGRENEVRKTAINWIQSEDRERKIFALEALAFYSYLHNNYSNGISYLEKAIKVSNTEEEKDRYQFYIALGLYELGQIDKMKAILENLKMRSKNENLSSFSESILTFLSKNPKVEKHFLYVIDQLNENGVKSNFPVSEKIR